MEHAVLSTLIHTHTQDKQHPGISELMGDSKITHTEKMNVCACVMTGHAVVLCYSWINQRGKIVLPKKNNPIMQRQDFLQFIGLR